MNLLIPRNTLVLVRLKKKKDERVGQIYVPNGDQAFSEAEVLAVGADTLSVPDSERVTRDLKPGQRVLVQTHKPTQRGLSLCGIEVKEVVSGERDLYLFEQNNILAILAQPEDIIKETE